jgi:DNA-binding MarR family transcriptional regulator
MNESDRDGASTTTAGDTTIASLLHAAHALEDKLESALGQVGLSMPKFSVLGELVRAGTPLALSELASRLSCVRSNMTQLIDRLEADGLVRRVDCPTDRRSVQAEITEKGRAKHEAGTIEVTRVEDQFRASLAADDRAALTKMLGSIG